jgi:hypothetical protein
MRRIIQVFYRESVEAADLDRLALAERAVGENALRLAFRRPDDTRFVREEEGVMS